MKLSPILLAATVLALAACGGAASQPAAPSDEAVPPQRPPNVLFGQIKSMTAAGDHFELQFDPAFWLSGVAAQRAALEDTGSSDVPNDYYIVDEGHRLLTFVVTADAHVTVVTREIRSVAIPPDELLEIVNGRNPEGRALFGSKLPFWIRIGEKYPNAAVAIDQQYRP
jgi:hypothetical protein